MKELMTIGHIIKCAPSYNDFGRRIDNDNEYAIPIKFKPKKHRDSWFETESWDVQRINIENGVLKLKYVTLGYPHWFRECTEQELEAFHAALKDSRYVLGETGLVAKPIETLEELKQELLYAHLSERLTTAIKQLL